MVESPRIDVGQFEDDPETRRLVSDLLDRRKYNVIFGIPDLPSALIEIDSWDKQNQPHRVPDIVIVDGNLIVPGKNLVPEGETCGTLICKKIRSIPNNKIKILGLSSDYRLSRLGVADAFLMKPFDIADFSEAMKTLSASLRRSRSR